MFMGENKDSVKWTHNGVEYVRFKDEDFAAELKMYETFEITVYGKCMKNSWQGRITPQIVIDDYNVRDTTNEF